MIPRKYQVSENIVQQYDQAKLLKRVLLVSIALHLGFFLFKVPDFFPAKVMTQDSEFAIDAELVMESLAVPQIKPKDPVPELVTLSKPEEMLPQLPNKFKVKEETVESVAKNEETPSEKTPPPVIEKETPTKEEINKEKVEAVAKPVANEDEKNKKEIELSKKDALERLKKEVLRRQEKPVEKEEPVKLSAALKKRKEQLLSGFKGGTISLTDQSGYGKTLRGWILKFYALPEVYNYKGYNRKAVIQLVLDARGGISELKIVETSQDKVFDELALKTIKDAIPFPTPPRDWVGKNILLPFEIAKK